MGDIAKALQKIGAQDLAGGGMTQGTRPAFVPKPPQGKKKAVVGKGRTPAASGGSGNSLTELTYATREYWPTRTIYSSDGSIAIQVRPVKAVVLTTGARLEFKEPT